MELNGTVAVVTGGGTGIGRAVCESLARAGAAAVVVNYSRSADEAEATAEAVRALGASAEAIKADVSDEAAVRAMVDQVQGSYGRTDVLVNNAGVTRFVEFSDIDALTDEVWQHLLGVNVLGAFRCARAFAPSLREAEGHVVNIASVAGHFASGSSLAYSVSKAAMLHMTKGLAVALGPQVRVNSVSPGLVETRWHTDRLGADGYEQLAASQRKRNPLLRTAEPADVARAVMAFLTTDLITGEDLIVDGGQHVKH
ncbi:SDR family oxidoreductase [Actinomycetes bacterium KLBMP 9759]